MSQIKNKMNNTTIIGLVIVFGWLILGSFSLVDTDIFCTGLVAFIIGSYLVILDEQETKEKRKKDRKLKK